MKCLLLKIITLSFKKCSMGQAKFVYSLNSASGPRAYTFEAEREEDQFSPYLFHDHKLFIPATYSYEAEEIPACSMDGF